MVNSGDIDLISTAKPDFWTINSIPHFPKFRAPFPFNVTLPKGKNIKGRYRFEDDACFPSSFSFSDAEQG